jgi:RNA polymerase sigma-70 factor, ECF subfamily
VTITDTPELETRLRALTDGGDLATAATAAVEGYGPEILGYLIAVARSEDDGREAFASFCEDLWRGLAAFAWRSSFRTWAYTLARHALARHLRDPARRSERHVPLSQAPELARLAAHVTTTTLAHLRTAARDRVARLRDALSPEEQALLILRVDRGMAWTDVAAILASAEDGAEVDCAREAARLRKQFERIVARLREDVSRGEP